MISSLVQNTLVTFYRDMFQLVESRVSVTEAGNMVLPFLACRKLQSLSKCATARVRVAAAVNSFLPLSLQ